MFVPGIQTATPVQEGTQSTQIAARNSSVASSLCEYVLDSRKLNISVIVLTPEVVCA